MVLNTTLNKVFTGVHLSDQQNLVFLLAVLLLIFPPRLPSCKLHHFIGSPSCYSLDVADIFEPGLLMLGSASDDNCFN
jgi:hypothetical protein